MAEEEPVILLSQIGSGAVIQDRPLFLKNNMTTEKLQKKLRLYIILHGNSTIKNCQGESCCHYNYGRCLFNGWRRNLYYQSHDGGKTIGKIDGLFEETNPPVDIYFRSCVEFLNKDNK